MTTQDRCCTLVPYFKIHDGKIDDFKRLCEEFMKLTETEDKLMFYGFSFCGDEAHCREGYADADGVLQHLENVGGPLGEALKIADITRLEVHGPAEEVDRLRQPLAELNPQFFVLEYGFRR